MKFIYVKTKHNKNLDFQSQKRLYNHKCLFVRPFVCSFVCKTPQQLEIIILHHSSFIIHPSSFILHHSSFILHSSFIILCSSFLHFATFKLFSLFTREWEPICHDIVSTVHQLSSLNFFMEIRCWS